MAFGVIQEDAPVRLIVDVPVLLKKLVILAIEKRAILLNLVGGRISGALQAHLLAQGVTQRDHAAHSGCGLLVGRGPDGSRLVAHHVLAALHDPAIVNVVRPYLDAIWHGHVRHLVVAGAVNGREYVGRQCLHPPGQLLLQVAGGFNGVFVAPIHGACSSWRAQHVAGAIGKELVYFVGDGLARLGVDVLLVNDL